MASYQDRMDALGSLRFTRGAEFSKTLDKKTSIAVRRMLGYLADNYPATEYSRISRLFRAFSEEKEKALQSLYAISNDSFHSLTRPEYLFQTLGDLLFIEDKAGGVDYTDSSYREFLLKVRNAYFGGSTLVNINKALSDILGIPVTVREAYLDARKAGGRLSMLDCNRLIADVMMDSSIDSAVSILIRDLYYFIDLIKPAHVLFDTRLVWTETINTVGCPADFASDYGFAADANGNAREYLLEALEEDVYSLERIVWGVTLENNDGMLTPDWHQGVVEEIDTDKGTIGLLGGKVLVVYALSKAYAMDLTDGHVYHTHLGDLTPGKIVFFLGRKAKGKFTFARVPIEVAHNSYRQFDPLVIASSEFQSLVITKRDSLGRGTLVPREELHSGESCIGGVSIGDAGGLLDPSYEDLRDNCNFPSVVLMSAIGITPEVPLVSVSGKTVLDNPEKYLNDSAVLELSDNGRVLYVPSTPLSNKSGGGLASVDDITIYLDGVKAPGDLVESVDPWAGSILLSHTIPKGTTVQVVYSFQAIYPVQVSEYFNRASTAAFPEQREKEGDLPALVSIVPPSDKYPVVYFRWPFVPENSHLYGNTLSYQVNAFPMLDRNGNLARKEDITILFNGVEVPDAVEYVRALLGHVQLKFLPPATNVTIQYYYQKNVRSYPLMMDSDQHLMDAPGGMSSTYHLLMDPFPLPISAPLPFSLLDTPMNGKGYRSWRESLDKYVKPIEYGYRFRAFALANTAVLGSSNTLLTGMFNKPSEMGSFDGAHGKLGSANLQFSGEYLYDTDKYMELNDRYLDNGLPALMVLRKGVPPFYRTFTGSSRYIYEGANPSPNREPSGLIEYSPIEKYPENKRIRLYSGLYETSTSEGDESIALSPFCDDGGIDLKFGVTEKYFPNREIRLNDYEDYLHYTSEVLSTKALLWSVKGSNIIKTKEFLWYPVHEGVQLEVLFEDKKGTYSRFFTVIAVVNTETVRLDQMLPEDGVFAFNITKTEVQPRGAQICEVLRTKKLNLRDSAYGLFTFYPNTLSDVWEVDVTFPDPDPDPYPRSGLPASPNSPPLLTSQIDASGSYEQFYQTVEEADKLVKFRNWDQEVVILSMGLIHDAVEEGTDDNADSVKVLFWNVSKREAVWYSFRGTVLMTSERIGVVDAVSRPQGVIRLKNPDDLMGVLADEFELRKLVVRQILPDNTVDIVVLDEFVRI